MHVVGGGRGEEHERRRRCRRPSPAAGRDPLEDLARAVRIVAERLRVVGRDVAGRDGVDVDPVRRPLVRERLRELRDPTLARCVPGDVDSALEGEQRGDEDDLPCSALHHEPADLAGEHELRRQVHFQDLVPLLVAVLGRRVSPNRSCVVDEHVDRRPARSASSRGRRPRLPIGEVAVVWPRKAVRARRPRARRPPSGSSVCADRRPCPRRHRRTRSTIALPMPRRQPVTSTVEPENEPAVTSDSR